MTFILSTFLLTALVLAVVAGIYLVWRAFQGEVVSRFSGWPLDVLNGIALFVIFSILAFIALMNSSLPILQRWPFRVAYAEGVVAIALGCIFLAVSFAGLGYALRFTRYRTYYVAFLTVVWIGVVFWASFWRGSAI